MMVKYSQLNKGITLAVMVLFIGVSFSTNAMTFDDKSSDEQITITKSDAGTHYLSMDSKYVDNSFKHKEMISDSHLIFEEGRHPAFGRNYGTHMAAYRDDDIGEIAWTFSADDGASYDPGVYYNTGGDYPSIKHWDDTIFYGTCVTDYLDSDGGSTYLFRCADPTDYGSYSLLYFDWSSIGWHDMIDADIACDSSQNIWEWGFSTYIISTSYGDGYTNGPTLVYMDPGEDYNGWIIWGDYENCAHTDVDIDHETLLGYAVYDQDENLDDNWRLLCRVKDFENVQNGYDEWFEITGNGNLEYPAVAAQDGNIVILAETDELGNKDIICLYGINMSNLQSSYVAMTLEDETYPDVRHLEGQTFICTFLRDGKIFAKISEDGGATWDYIIQIDGCIDEYKTSDLCENGFAVMYEGDGGVHLYYIELWPPPSGIFIDVEGGFGFTVTVSHNYPFNLNELECTVSVTGGVLGFVNKQFSDSISILQPEEEFTFKSGLILGLGAIEILVVVTSSEYGKEETYTGLIFGPLILGVNRRSYTK